MPASPPLVTISGPIGPSTADYVARTLTAAERGKAPFVVIRIDTPGGLSRSMRKIIHHILAAPVPVICWVGPPGARAASAGTYILYACGLSAMAPGTHVGAATPVSLLGSARSTPPKPATAAGKKRLNDAIAYLRSLAELRGRNVNWAETAVRDAASISASQALKLHVIDLTAANLPALLSRINGLAVPVASGKTVRIDTTGIALNPAEPDWRERLLGVITAPTMAYLLFIIGLYGLLLEGLHPGTIVPGVVGAIALILALFAFQSLPVNYAGLALILLGMALVVAEAFVPSFGALGLGGLSAFIAGSILLIDTHAPGYALPPIYIGSIAAAAGLSLGLVLYLILRVRHRPVVSGRERMIAAQAVALEDFDVSGLVRVEGERWQAQSDSPVHRGDKLTVTAIQGLKLTVHPIKPSSKET